MNKSHRAPVRDTLSPWVERFVPLIPPGGTVLDVAAGGGRHTRHLAERGERVVAVDIDTSRLSGFEGYSDVEIVEADLESNEWLFAGRRFDGIVVVNYLHRPLLPVLAESLRQDGVLIYDTFAEGNEQYGRPSNPAFLLRPGELLDVFSQTLEVVAYEHGFVETPSPSVRQRICARYLASPPALGAK